VSCILNRVCIGAAGQQSETETIGQAQGGCADCEGVAPFTEMEASTGRPAVGETRPLAVVPCSTDLAAPRVLDVAQALRARVVFAGEIRTRRVSDVGLCAATCRTRCGDAPGLAHHHPGDRSDIMMAAALSVQSGPRSPACCSPAGTDPTPRRATVRKALDTGCPCWRSTSRATAQRRTWRA